jgi:metal-responsive CopG/Arc/MetJ family transcriptional regulator
MTIQLVIDEPLLEAATQAARQRKQNRSALIREALRIHLRRLRHRSLIEQELRGYELIPDSAEDAKLWEGVEAWPED